MHMDKKKETLSLQIHDQIRANQDVATAVFGLELGSYLAGNVRHWNGDGHRVLAAAGTRGGFDFANEENALGKLFAVVSLDVVDE